MYSHRHRYAKFSYSYSFYANPIEVSYFSAILGDQESQTYHINTINSTKFKTLILGIQNNVHHSAHL